MTLLSHRFSGRALTVRNPWPFAIRFLDKDIENRSKPAPDWLVGPDAPWIALHTGQHAPTVEELHRMSIVATNAGRERRRRADGWDLWKTIGSNVRLNEPPRCAADHPLGVLTGVFRITAQDASWKGASGGWREDPEWGYHIEYRPFPSPIPCTGPTPKPGKRGSSNLGWWRTPDAVTSRIAGMIADVCGG